jgi:hypothetical protein
MVQSSCEEVNPLSEEESMISTEEEEEEEDIVIPVFRVKRSVEHEELLQMGFALVASVSPHVCYQHQDGFAIYYDDRILSTRFHIQFPDGPTAFHMPLRDLPQAMLLFKENFEAVPADVAVAEGEAFRKTFSPIS